MGQAIFGAVFYTLLIFLVISYVYRIFSSKSRSDTIFIDGTRYEYEIGDMLMNDANASDFSGLVLTLPKRLPHIYIDGHSDERMRGPRYTYPSANKLSLEGDFDRSFQVYALPRYHSLCLSILTPDAMAVLVDLLPQYDVEIVGNQLSIISRRRITKHADRQQALVDALKHIAPQILHRIRSWSEQDAATAGRYAMRGQPYDIVKFGRSAISSIQFIGAIMFGIPGIGIMAMAIWFWSSPYATNTDIAPWVFGLGFLIFPCSWLIYILIDRNKLRR